MQTTMDHPASAAPVFGNGERANKLKSTRFGSKLVNDYWGGVFAAKENGSVHGRGVISAPSTV